MFYKGTIKDFSNMHFLGTQVAAAAGKGPCPTQGQFPSPRKDGKERTETRCLCWSRSQTTVSEGRSIWRVATREADAGEGGGQQQAGNPLQISSAVQEGQTDASSQREMAAGCAQPLSWPYELSRGTCLRCTSLRKTRAQGEAITTTDVHDPAKQLARLVLPSAPNPGSLKAFRNCTKTQLELRILIAAFLHTCSSAKPPTSQCAPKACVSKEFYRAFTCLGENRFRGHKAASAGSSSQHAAASVAEAIPACNSTGSCII